MIIGLTGGIGSGKSAAGNFFEMLGITVIDSDILAKKALDIDSIGFNLAVDFFGPSILDSAGHIDRAQLRATVFNDSEKKAKLESIVHPIVRDLIFANISNSTSPYSIVMVPLIFESQSMSSYDRILVVDCDESLQSQRASARDGSSLDLIDKIINAQCTREERLSIANDVLPNNDTLDLLESKVAKLHKFYLGICDHD
jgi:dephospho-CoA kinase